MNRRFTAVVALTLSTLALGVGAQQKDGSRSKPAPAQGESSKQPAGQKYPQKQTANSSPGSETATSNAAEQFRRMKGLVGTWTGKASLGGSDPFDATFTYRLTANGTTLVEAEFVGSDHEMMTTYFMDGQDLVLTHYCAMGNQPHMKYMPPASGGDDNVLSFLCTGGTNMTENDAHMHASAITLVDQDHIKSRWTMFSEGKAINEANVELTRQKP